MMYEVGKNEIIDIVAEKDNIKTFRDLDVYDIAHKLAMKIFHRSVKFPKEERYSLVDQIRRSSRSIAVNIAEGWGKRWYEDQFKRHLIDSQGSLEETKSWLLFSYDAGYLTQTEYNELLSECEAVGAKLFRLHNRWRSF